MSNPAHDEADKETAERLGLDIKGKPDDPFKEAIDSKVPKADVPMRPPATPVFRK